MLGGVEDKAVQSPLLVFDGWYVTLAQMGNLATWHMERGCLMKSLVKIQRSSTVGWGGRK